MYDKEKVQEALELCKDIDTFYKNRISQEDWPGKESPSDFFPSDSVSIDHVSRNTNPEENALADSPKAGKKKGASVLLGFLRWAGSILACFFIAYGAARMVTDYVVQVTVVEGISMEDSLYDKDVLLVDRLSYRFRDPERFDVVIFPFSIDEYYVKRIIGLPGETIWIEDGEIYIDDKRLLEDFGKEEIEDGGIAESPVVLGEDEYFLMGDNRNQSKDSRSIYVGPVSRDMIKGRAYMRIYPFNTIAEIH